MSSNFSFSFTFNMRRTQESWSEFIVASSEPMYDSIRLKLVCVSSGVPRFFDAVRDGVTDSSHHADSIGLNKKQIVAILYQFCYGLSQNCNWFEWDDVVFLKGLSPESTRFSTKHLIGSSSTGKRQMKFFITCPLATSGASMSLFQGQF